VVAWARRALGPFETLVLDWASTALLEALDVQISLVEAKIAAIAVDDERVKLLMTMPGLEG